MGASSVHFLPLISEQCFTALPPQGNPRPDEVCYPSSELWVCPGSNSSWLWPEMYPQSYSFCRFPELTTKGKDTKVGWLVNGQRYLPSQLALVCCKSATKGMGHLSQNRKTVAPPPPAGARPVRAARKGATGDWALFNGAGPGLTMMLDAMCAGWQAKIGTWGSWPLASQTGQWDPNLQNVVIDEDFKPVGWRGRVITANTQSDLFLEPD